MYFPSTSPVLPASRRNSLSNVLPPSHLAIKTKIPEGLAIASPAAEVTVPLDQDTQAAGLSSTTSMRAPTLSSRPVAACFSHAARDFAGQAAGRVLGLAAFSLLAALDDMPLRAVNGVIGMAAGGRLAYLVASHQFGNETPLQQAGVTASTLFGMISGSLIAALGNSPVIAGLATGSLLTAAISWSPEPAHDDEARDRIDKRKALTAAGTTLIGTVATSFAVGAIGAKAAHLPSRNLGLLIESTVIELCKSSFERVGPSMDRNVLSFEGRVAVAMMGMVPYVAATVVLNGYVSGLLQPSYDSSKFNELVVPLVVGAVANAVRGFGNALAVHQLHRSGKFIDRPDADCVRTSAGPKLPEPGTVADKTCIRFLLSACRNAVYAHLRDRGMSVAQATELAQGIYACYAQCRDLIHDLARGDGWTEPVIARRVLPAQTAVPSSSE